MEQLPKLVRQRLRVAANQGGSHPGPDLLAAFTDQALGKAERVQVLEHLARCGDCREIVSLATSDFEAGGVVAPVPPSSGWLRGPILRWGALAASVAVVTVAVTIPRLSRHASVVSTTQSAQTDSKQNAPEARTDEPLDKLAASASPSYRALEPDSVVANQPKRAELSNRKNDVRVAKPSRSSKAAESDSAPPMSQAAVPASPPLVAKSADEDQAELKKEQGSHMQVAASNQIVTLDKAAPAELESAPGKAKDAPLKSRDAAAGFARNGAQALSSRAMADAGSIKNGELRSRGKLLPRWTLSADGTLQRSLDAGKTWTTIPVAGGSVFRALAAVGADIWVGGSAGSLYRSTDAGEHWLKVTPATTGKILTADIIGVEFIDANHGKLTTADEHTWSTADAGQTWQIN